MTAVIGKTEGSVETHDKRRTTKDFTKELLTIRAVAIAEQPRTSVPSHLLWGSKTISESDKHALAFKGGELAWTSVNDRGGYFTMLDGTTATSGDEMKVAVFPTPAGRPRHEHLALAGVTTKSNKVTQRRTGGQQISDAKMNVVTHGTVMTPYFTSEKHPLYPGQVVYAYFDESAWENIKKEKSYNLHLRAILVPAREMYARIDNSRRSWLFEFDTVHDIAKGNKEFRPPQGLYQEIQALRGGGHHTINAQQEIAALETYALDKLARTESELWFVFAVLSHYMCFIGNKPNLYESLSDTIQRVKHAILKKYHKLGTVRKITNPFDWAVIDLDLQSPPEYVF